MIYLDVHGTLFEYDYNLYNRKDVVWCDEGVHPFRGDKPLGNMPLVVEELIKRGFPVATLCRISKGSELAKSEQREDVLENLDKYYGGIKKKNRFFCEGSKSEFLKTVKSKISKQDILLEDYQPNAIDWEQAGGTAVKVLNGINSLKTWLGYHIDANEEPTEIVRVLTQIWAMQNRRFK